MPKSTKKRLRQDISAPPSFDNVVVSNLVSTPEDSLDSILAEMTEQQQALSNSSLPTATSYPSESSTTAIDTAVSSNDTLDHQQQQQQPILNNVLYDPTLPTRPFNTTSELRERISTWNRAMNVWQKSGKYTPGLLPSFDVEVARHFKVQSLSSFLLESCPELKMPAFERWYVVSLWLDKSTCFFLSRLLFQNSDPDWSILLFHCTYIKLKKGH
jgi:hypothetical protein